MNIHLAPREYEVWQLTATGLSVREMADRLGLCRSTVCKYRQTAKDELHAGNTVQLTLAAIARGVVQVEPIAGRVIVKDRWRRPVATKPATLILGRKAITNTATKCPPTRPPKNC